MSGRYTPKSTVVTESADRITIQTDARRSGAILMVLAGATLQQVGDELGVSRERIRQYLQDAHLTTKMRAPLFSEVFQDTDKERHTRRVWAKRDAMILERQGRIRRAVQIIKDFQRERGRVPTYEELCAHLIRRVEKHQAAPVLAGYLGRSGQAVSQDRRGKRGGRRGKQGRALQALYRLAGFPGKRVGAWTWTWTCPARARQTHCRRGHEMNAENTRYFTARGRRRRYCRACRNLTSRLRDAKARALRK
jgi:predicted transcriptional regulator